MFQKWFDTLRTSLTKPGEYDKLSQRTFWSGYWFLFWLILIGVFIQTFLFSIGLIALAPEVKKQIPTAKEQIRNAYPRELVVDIRNGVATTNVKEPYFITLKKVAPQFAKDGDYNLITIDTQASAEDYPRYKTGVLLTKNSFVYPGRNNSSTSYEVTPLTSITEPITIDRPTYESLISKLLPFLDQLPIFMYYFAVVGMLLFPILGSFFVLHSSLFYLLLATLLVLIVSALLKRKYSYKSLYKMSMYGLTVPLVVTYILGLFTIDVPWLYHILFFGWMICVLTLSPSTVYTQSNARQKKVSSGKTLSSRTRRS